MMDDLTRTILRLLGAALGIVALSVASAFACDALGFYAAAEAFAAVAWVAGTFTLLGLCMALPVLAFCLRTLAYRFCAWRARTWSADAELFLQAQGVAMRTRDWITQAEYRDYYAIAEAKARRWARRAQRCV